MKLKILFLFLFISLGISFGFSQVQNDSAAFQPRKFENLKGKYSDSDFNYVEKPTNRHLNYVASGTAMERHCTLAV